MAGVLSRAAGRLGSTTRPLTFKLTTVTRPTLAAGPNASIPRLIHTKVTPSQSFLFWFRVQIRTMVKEAVDAGLKDVRKTSLNRYERLSTRVTALSELSATRHSECMTMYVRTQERIAQIAFRVCVSMVGLAAASQYQDEIRKILLRIVDGGAGGESVPQQEMEKTVLELAMTVKELAQTVNEVSKSVKQLQDKK